MVLLYNAEDTVNWVLDRIPRVLLENEQTRVLVLDDYSTDSTMTVANEYRDAHPELDIVVHRHPRNLRYGGNQKAGYRYAAEHGFDVVAMIHGDGQYAPEELPRLLEPLMSGEADAVMGSRFLVRGGALAGGMPPYKYVGNRVLSFVQNLLLGSHFSEFHSGYRLYRVSTLNQMPVESMDDGYPFDTHIILELVSSGARIVEMPIPTYYGTEECRVNGMHYAWMVFWATARHSWRHRGGRGRSSLSTGSVESEVPCADVGPA